MPDSEKKKQILALGRTESSFLRLRRTRLGLQDFKTVKVIGKGAFGEVGHSEQRCLRVTTDIGLSERCSRTDFYALPRRLHFSSCITIPITGPCRAEDRYRQDLRDEDTAKERDVQEGSGVYHFLDSVYMHEIL